MTEEVASANLNTSVSGGSGRFRLVTEPALPATCAVCRRSANGAVRFVDFNFDLDYYGAVVFCEDCYKEGLSLFDYIPRERLVTVSEELRILETEYEVALHEFDKYKSIVTNLRDVGVISLADGVEPEEPAETVGTSEPADTGSEQDESDSDGSDSIGGLKNFSIFAD